MTTLRPSSIAHHGFYSVFRRDYAEQNMIMIFTLPSLIHFKYEDDEEKAEEFKIISFISMVNGCHHLGIPYGGEQNRHDWANNCYY